MKDIKGFEGRYSVSKDGRVWSHKNEIWLKPVVNKSGYERISFGNNTFLVHRLVASAYIPNTEKKPHINHIDNNRANNQVENLEWCTPKENTAHMVKSGRKPIGERNNFHKLTEAQVVEIRKLRESGLGNQVIAKMYKVHWTTVSMLHNRRKIWKHVL